GSLKISLKTIDPPVTFNENGSSNVPGTPVETALPPLEGEFPAVDNEAVYSHSKHASSQKSAPPLGSTPAPQKPPTINPDEPVYRVFVIKRSGKVVGVVPINRMEEY